jgi:molybdopterin synthase sulfur carrier subunit
MFLFVLFAERRKMACVEFSSPLKKYTNNLARFEVHGGTVGEAMKEVEERFPEIKDKLLRDDGTLRAFFIIFVDDKDVRMLDREQTPVRTNSVIRIVPAIAGG